MQICIYDTFQVFVFRNDSNEPQTVEGLELLDQGKAVYSYYNYSPKNLHQNQPIDGIVARVVVVVPGMRCSE